MNERDLLISHVSELKRKAEENSMITVTNFLTDEQISNLTFLEKINNKYVDTFYYGGYDEAQRQIVVFVPKFYAVNDIYTFFVENEEDNPVCLLKLQKDRFSALSHRDYLGAVMGLGVTREMIGDIVAFDDGAYIFCVKKIAKYLCENLSKVGKGTVECVKCDFSEFSLHQENLEDVFSSVASLRLDNIISAAFNLSRCSASQVIKQGSVFVNNAQCLKSDFNVKQGDKLVLRGKGKTVLKEIKGETKKGRIHIIIKKYK